MSEIAINRAALRRALNAASMVIERRHRARPILSCVLLTLGENEVQIQATDLDNHLTQRLEGVGDGGQQRIVIDHSILQQVVSAASAAELRLRVEFKPEAANIVRNAAVHGMSARSIAPLLGYEGPPVSLGLNARYLGDAVDFFAAGQPDAGINIDMADPGSPLRLTDTSASGRLAVLMPMRI